VVLSFDETFPVVGALVCICVGPRDLEGEPVGASDVWEGLCVGASVGASEVWEGLCVGASDGASDGAPVGVVYGL